MTHDSKFSPTWHSLQQMRVSLHIFFSPLPFFGATCSTLSPMLILYRIWWNMAGKKCLSTSQTQLVLASLVHFDEYIEEEYLPKISSITATIITALPS